MWQQNYTPVVGSLPLSALIAAVPIFTLLFLLGVKRKPAWISSLIGLAAAILVAALIYRMPLGPLFSSVIMGAAFGLWPIGWVVFTAVLLYRVTLESGKFELLKDSIAHLADDKRLQVLLIAFAFGAFVEGAAGFGTPVAFGSLAIPITTLAVTTGLPVDRLSAGVGRICAPVSLFIPAYLILVMSGWKALRAVLPAAAVCGLLFGGMQFLISNFVGPQLTDIIASLCAMGGLVVLFHVWKPRDVVSGVRGGLQHSAREIALAWGPYILLVICVLAWGYPPVTAWLASKNIVFQWPGLHNMVQRVPPVVARPSGYGAVFTFTWLAASGTAVLLAAILGSFVAGMAPARFVKTIGRTAKQLVLAELTLASV